MNNIFKNKITNQYVCQLSKDYVYTNGFVDLNVVLCYTFVGKIIDLWGAL